MCMYVCDCVFVCHAWGVFMLVGWRGCAVKGVEESMYVYSSAGSTSSSYLQRDLEWVDKQPRTVSQSSLAGHHRVFRVTHERVAA